LARDLPHRPYTTVTVLAIQFVDSVMTTTGRSLRKILLPENVSTQRSTNVSMTEDLVAYLENLRLTFGVFDDIVPDEMHEQVKVTCHKHKGGHERKPSMYISSDPAKFGLVHCFTCGWKGNLDTLLKDLILDTGIQVHIPAPNARERLDLNPERQAEKPQPVYPPIPEPVYTEYIKNRGVPQYISDAFGVSYNALFNTILFPLIDQNGNNLGNIERKLDQKFYHIPEGIERPLYGYAHAMKQIAVFDTQTVLITEGVIDVLKAWQSIPAVGTLGQPSEYQLELLRKMPNRVFILACDHDEAGYRFNETIKDALIDTKILYKFSFPFGKKDIGEMSLEEIDFALERLEPVTFL
jgi:hypothetical protein